MTSELEILTKAIGGNASLESRRRHALRLLQIEIHVFSQTQTTWTTVTSQVAFLVTVRLTTGHSVALYDWKNLKPYLFPSFLEDATTLSVAQSKVLRLRVTLQDDTDILEQMSKTLCLMRIAVALVLFIEGHAVLGEEIGAVRLMVRGRDRKCLCSVSSRKNDETVAAVWWRNPYHKSKREPAQPAGRRCPEEYRLHLCGGRKPAVSH